MADFIFYMKVMSRYPADGAWLAFQTPVSLTSLGNVRGDGKLTVLQTQCEDDLVR